jgi:hypothetical protein
MWNAKSAFGILSLRRHSLAFMGALALWLGLGLLELALARAAYDGMTPEEWARSQIMQGKPADFDQRCDPKQPPLDFRHNEGDPRWWTECRKLSARFLQKLLTEVPSRVGAIRRGSDRGSLDYREYRS